MCIRDRYKIAGRIYAANVMDAGLNQNNFYNATVYYEYTANHKHTFVTYTYTYTNSCTEPGERVTKCKDCGYIPVSYTHLSDASFHILFVKLLIKIDGRIKIVNQFVGFFCESSAP